MSRIWEPQPINVYLDWIEQIMQATDVDGLTYVGETLNDWESKFVDSVQTRLLNQNNLTELQAKKLEAIYVEKTK